MKTVESIEVEVKADLTEFRKALSEAFPRLMALTLDELDREIERLYRQHVTYGG
jgi:hypothetical protein